MSRRDTIIIAVIVNAGLLIVLFASALKSPSGIEFVSAPPPAVHEPFDHSFKNTPSVAGDEVDQALGKYSQNAPAVASVAQTPAAQQEMPSLPNFADDLKMIAQTETPPPAASQTPKVQTLMAPITKSALSAPDFTEIKVKKGDVLEKIARYHHTTVAEIMKVNKLTSTNLRIGQVLKIPNKAIKKAETSSIAHSDPTPSTSGNDGGDKYYIVKKGDSPWTIAMKNHLKVEDLLKLNNMSETEARHLKPGDKLRIQ
jgi:LysM repeat protein